MAAGRVGRVRPPQWQLCRAGPRAKSARACAAGSCMRRVVFLPRCLGRCDDFMHAMVGGGAVGHRLRPDMTGHLRAGRERGVDGHCRNVVVPGVGRPRIVGCRHNNPLVGGTCGIVL